MRRHHNSLSVKNSHIEDSGNLHSAHNVNKPFKQLLRASWTQYLKRAVSYAGDGQEVITTTRQVTDWIVSAWQAMKEKRVYQKVLSSMCTDKSPVHPLFKGMMSGGHSINCRKNLRKMLKSLTVKIHSLTLFQNRTLLNHSQLH